jgi:pimeloyl-ACP methyl ester carboxylesterase
METIAHLIPHELEASSDLWMPADRIAKISVPALLLVGGASPAWAHNTVRAVADAIPGARHTSLDGQTHGAADDVLAPVLVDFFTQG